VDVALADHRAQLRQCAGEPAECAPEIIGYFSVVRDREAAALLVALLDITAIPDPFLAGAVANQADHRSEEALRRFGVRFPSYNKLVADLLSARVEAAAACGAAQKTASCGIN